LIRVGSRGEDVARIQRCLNSIRGRFPSIGQLNPDGVFGPLTQASVIAFQRAVGLNPDGVVGPLTWNALMPECHGNSIPAYPGFLIRVGARGDYVRQIQTCLNQVNRAGLNPDGVFGPLTQAAVMNFQRANGLNPDGIVGPITWENLMRRCAGSTARAAIQPDPPPARNMPIETQEITTSANEPLIEPQYMENMPGKIEFAPGGAPHGEAMPYAPGVDDLLPCKENKICTAEIQINEMQMNEQQYEETQPVFRTINHGHNQPHHPHRHPPHQHRPAHNHLHQNHPPHGNKHFNMSSLLTYLLLHRMHRR